MLFLLCIQVLSKDARLLKKKQLCVITAECQTCNALKVTAIKNGGLNKPFYSHNLFWLLTAKTEENVNDNYFVGNSI